MTLKCVSPPSVGSLSHYEHPSYYDKCYAGRVQDVAFYRSVARSAGSVLEHGCGNGRIALPIARDGIPIVGLDLSAAMLDSFRKRLGRETDEVRNRVSVFRGDMRTKRFRQRFDLIICAFNTFLHLYDRNDVERYLALVRRHLAHGGVFAFDTSLPVPEELARDPKRPFVVPRLKHPDSGLVVRYAEYFDYDPLTQVLRVTMRFDPSGGVSAGWTVLLEHRQYYPQEIEALLHYNGFVLESMYPNLGDGTGAPVDSIGWLARCAKDRSGRVASRGTISAPCVGDSSIASAVGLG